MVVNCVSHKYEILSTALIKVCLFNAVNRMGRQPNARKQLFQSPAATNCMKRITIVVYKQVGLHCRSSLATAPKVTANQTVKQWSKRVVPKTIEISCKRVTASRHVSQQSSKVGPNNVSKNAKRTVTKTTTNCMRGEFTKTRKKNHQWPATVKVKKNRKALVYRQSSDEGDSLLAYVPNSEE